MSTTNQSTQQVLDFGGKTYVPALDHDRLKNALERILAFMQDGQWRTLRYIALECNCSESGASARLRDFRKKSFERYGVSEVQRKRIEGGLYAYRIVMQQTE